MERLTFAWAIDLHISPKTDLPQEIAIATKEKDKILRKNNVRDAVPASLKAALDKPRLRELTFNDLQTVYTQMQKFFDLDSSASVKPATIKWRA